MASWDERNRRARALGYEGQSQRQRLRDYAASGNLEDSAELRHLIETREEEMDYGSIGEIFKDLLDRIGEDYDDDDVIALRGIFSPSSV